ncbi:acyltransferase family protein [Serinibacter arcticus]|uniref:acyltransferase family protein n=1 Tax=Serinibacter arcticus TaxID=1655435 RepID=UPI0013052F7D|nr:acyltransferase family protein [Serinibacter arcticus]
MPGDGPGDRRRPDIQGLRALAVGLVVVYHVWPGVLPGGFVGVDVFFVISGYLIIDSLTREVERRGTVDIPGFYVRRVRRLLPAASAAIVATVVLSLVVLEDSQLRRNLGDAIAASLQVANWRFALGPDAYAQATASVSPFQHFWSLAVEEQFYLVVPVVMIAVALLVRSSGLALLPTVATVLALLGAASLTLSVVLTSQAASIAYYSTVTRAWELLLGGLAALALRRLVLTRAASTSIGVVGVLLVLASATTMTTSMPFPGVLALVPVVGTILLLAAGTVERAGGVTVVLGVRPLTWLGDVSYSLYLWHWPIVVGALAVSGPTLGLLGGPVVIAASLIAAWASERFVERPFRRPTLAIPTPARRRQRRHVLLLGGAVTASVTAMGAIPLVVVEMQTSSVSTVASDHPGALALGGAPVPSGVPVAPDPRIALQDVPLVFRDGCISEDITTVDPGRDPRTCHYGDDGSTVQVVLVGDSHAAVLSTPLAALADQEHFEVTAYLRNGCPFTVRAPVGLGDCEAQNDRVLNLLTADPPDVVVVTSMTPFGYREALGWDWESFDAAVAGYTETVEILVDAAIPVVVVRDTPYMPFSPPDCVAAGRACSLTRSAAASQRDPLVEAALEVQGAVVADLTNHVCGPTSCDSVVGNVLVYRDNHLTDTYATTLSQALWTTVGPAIDA